MGQKFGGLHRGGLVLIVALIAIAAWMKPLEAPASDALNAAMKKAFVTFATARALNAGISFLQSGQVSVPVLGGLSAHPGEVLDPLNDLVEQFSNVMLAATVALGIQQILLAVGAHWLLPVLIASVASLVVCFIAWRGTCPRWISQAFVLLLMVRFAVPLATLGTEALSATFLKGEYERSQDALRDVHGKSEEAGRMSPANESAPGLWDRFKRGVSDLGDIRERLSALKKAADQLAERVTMMIVVFLFETVIFPLSILWLLYMAAKAVFRPSVPSAYAPIETK